MPLAPQTTSPEIQPPEAIAQAPNLRLVTDPIPRPSEEVFDLYKNIGTTDDPSYVLRSRNSAEVKSTLHSIIETQSFSPDTPKRTVCFADKAGNIFDNHVLKALEKVSANREQAVFADPEDDSIQLEVDVSAIRGLAMALPRRGNQMQLFI